MSCVSEGGGLCVGCWLPGEISGVLHSDGCWQLEGVRRGGLGFAGGCLCCPARVVAVFCEVGCAVPF